MRVLVTRPEPDATRLAGILRARGHKPVLAPLMRVEFTGDTPPSGIERAVLLFTSSNGVRAAKAHGVHSASGVFVVGEATAALAREVGFGIDGIAEGDVASLAELVANRLPKDRFLIHVAGSDVAGDLAGALGARGCVATRWTAYAARAVDALPAPAGEFIKGEPGAVLLYSPRSARLLTHLIGKAGLEPLAARHRALCLSHAVSNAASGISWASLEVAAKPSQEALLNLLG